MRDITIGETFDVKFTTTEPDTGAPATLAGTPVVSAYVGNSTTQITAGITLSVDFDGVTGLHNVRVVATTGNGYADGTDVSLVITTGTVDAVSAVGYVIENFTIGRSAANSAVKPVARATYLNDSTIATLSSQTSFTLTAGSADNDAYNGMAFIFTDVTTAAQKGIAFASDYVGSTRTVTLEAGPIFTIATTDLVTIVPAGGSTSLPPAVNVTQWSGTAVATPSVAGVPEVDVTHCAGAAQATIATQASVNTIDDFLDTEMAAVLAAVDTEVAAILADTNELQTDLANGGRLDLLIDGIKAKTDSLTFTVANVVDANVQRINDVAITGDGGTGTEFSV
jgi:hypothetical protein